MTFPKLFTAAAIAGSVLTSSAFALTPITDFNREAEYTTNKNKPCGTLYRKAKAIARDAAKRHCRMTFGSGGRAIKNVGFLKLTCSRAEGKGTVRIYYNCR